MCRITMLIFLTKMMVKCFFFFKKNCFWTKLRTDSKTILIERNTLMEFKQVLVTWKNMDFIRNNTDGNLIREALRILQISWFDEFRWGKVSECWAFPVQKGLNDRSNNRRCCLKVPQYPQENTCVGVSLF